MERSRCDLVILCDNIVPLKVKRKNLEDVD